MFPIAIVAAVEPGINPLGLSGEPELVFREASRMGYDGVELVIKDPSSFDVNKVERLSEEFGLSVAAVGTVPTYMIYGLSLSSPEKRIREKAIERIKEYLEIGHRLNSPIIIGSVKGKPEDRRRGMENLKSSLRVCAEYAEKIEARILIEPLNRYESTIVNTLREAVNLRNELGSESIGVMADTFHMNIEERSLYDSIVEADGYLGHMHIADNNRLAPGEGHLDFNQVMAALDKIGYRSFLSAEILPLPNPREAAEKTIRYIKMILS